MIFYMYKKILGGNTMKKAVLILSFFVVLSMFLASQFFNQQTEYYAKSGIITLVDRTEDRVCFTDHQRLYWEFESADDWKVNDLVACIMSNNGTENIYDDIVINVKYEG